MMIQQMIMNLIQQVNKLEFLFLDKSDDLDEDEEEDDFSPQPVHFRECLRLLDAALTSSNPPILPRWCASEQIGMIDDPMLLINGHKKCLSLPLDKREARRFIRNAQPLEMKIDIVDGVSVCHLKKETGA